MIKNESWYNQSKPKLQNNQAPNKELITEIAIERLIYPLKGYEKALGKDNINNNLFIILFFNKFNISIIFFYLFISKEVF
jgi:hypothetical protein